MTIEQWRTNTGLVDWMKGVQKSAEWKIFMEAMEASHPRWFRFNQLGFNEPSAVKQLGRIEGYDEAIAHLMRAAELLKQQEMPQETFEPEIPEPQTKPRKRK